MVKIRLLVAIASAKLAAKMVRLTKRGGATALPGLIALKIAPELISQLAGQLKKGIVVISGTNGKTTTARILADILKEEKIEFIHNRAGSNLLRGLASVFTQKATILGRIKAEMAVFEVDEATLPLILEEVTPKLTILTNLFRDQLDRYGEINTIAQKWSKSVQKLTDKSSLLLNADDPAIAQLAENTSASVYYYGIDDQKQGQQQLSRFADSKYCGWCATPLDYELVYISHLGKYTCSNCGKARPEPQFSAFEINFKGLQGSRLKLKIGNEIISTDFALPGLYNIYNALAAAAAAKLLGVETKKIRKALGSFKAAFGRVERIKADQRELVMFLVKNPTGFNEVIRMLLSDAEKKQLLMAVNDKLADGRDVSWLWDVDFEKMADKVNKLIVTGLRAYDLGLRLKYAGINNVDIKPNLNEALTNLFIATKPNQIIYLLPTYTAMLELRKKLAKFAKTGHFWED